MLILDEPLCSIAAVLKFLGKYRESGLLLLRASVGVIFIVLCGPVLLGGEHAWTHFGSGMRALDFYHHFAVWGFLGALAACAGGVLMIIGFAFRLGVLLCFLVALVDAIGTTQARGYFNAMAVIEMGIVLIALSFVGPGKYSVDKG